MPEKIHSSDECCSKRKRNTQKPEYSLSDRMKIKQRGKKGAQKPTEMIYDFGQTQNKAKNNFARAFASIHM